MQDVVSRAISCLYRRNANKEIDHPDNEAAFILARYLQGEDIPLIEAEPYATQFYETAKKEDLLMCADGEEIDQTTLNYQLEEAWPKVKVKLGLMYELAVKQAKKNGIPEKAKQIPDKPAQQLAAVCRELQKCNGKRPFYLSHIKAGEIMGMGRRAGAARLSALIKCGVIKLHRKGHTGLASEYYYSTKGI
jgi:hypothetical protein